MESLQKRGVFTVFFTVKTPINLIAAMLYEHHLKQKQFGREYNNKNPRALAAGDFKPKPYHNSGQIVRIDVQT